MLPTNLIEARKLLLRNWPFYGMPALQAGDPVFTETMPTAATDGIHIFLNPQFIHRMPVPHLAAVIAHECIHIICTHPDMLAKKLWPDGSPITDTGKLNRAADFWINWNLIDEGFQFPPIGICHDTTYKGKTIKEIYYLLPDQPTPPQPPNGGQPDPNSPPNGDPAAGKGGISGGDDICPKALTPEEIAEHRIQVRQASEAAKGQGKLPGWADQYIQKLSRPRITFKDFFEPWLHDALDKDDASYRRLNRHYLPDFYAPTIVGLSFGNLIFGLDTSGSCWDQSAKFLGLVNTALKQLRPVASTLLQFDADIQGPPTLFAPGENLEAGKPIKIYGGGGTDFRPVFDWVAKHHNNAIDGLIMLTDLYGTFPSVRPPYPTLWVTIASGTKAPFGTTFYLHEGQED